MAKTAVSAADPGLPRLRDFHHEAVVLTEAIKGIEHLASFALDNREDDRPAAVVLDALGVAWSASKRLSDKIEALDRISLPIASSSKGDSK